MEKRSIVTLTQEEANALFIAAFAPENTIGNVTMIGMDYESGLDTYTYEVNLEHKVGSLLLSLTIDEDLRICPLIVHSASRQEGTFCHVLRVFTTLYEFGFFQDKEVLNALA